MKKAHVSVTTTKTTTSLSERDIHDIIIDHLGLKGESNVEINAHCSNGYLNEDEAFTVIVTNIKTQ
jgi:hypothetical protein